MGILKACKPRKEVLKGDLEDAIFAADFGDLIRGKAPTVYGDPEVFFQNTHPAQQLKKVIEVVFTRLAKKKEGGATIRLSTGFGGGKTHTLMALWHLAKNIDNPSLGTELLPAAGRPPKVTVAAVDAQKAGVPEFTTHEKIKVHSLWGEIFYQLGGEKALKSLGKADDPEASPSESQIEAVLPKGPILFLFDEIVIYMAQLSERGQGNLLGFLSKLASITIKRPQTVMIVTDPARQIAYYREASQIKEKLETAAQKLDEVFSRKVSDFDPIGEESARVIARRLFEDINPAAAQAASAAYNRLYERVLQESPELLPKEIASKKYSQRAVECYPFHPRLLDTAKDRLGALQDFHKSRGVLRLFARILRDVWEEKKDIELITAGDINWSSQRIQADLLQRLNRDNFKPAISADIEKHAAELDGGKSYGIHRRAASALLLESLPLQSNSGLDYQDLTLAVLRPDEAGPEPKDALDRLLGVCWHLYPMAGKRSWQFRYEENILKKVEQRKSQISMEDAKHRVLAEVQGYFPGISFKVSAWPISAKAVSKMKDLQLALCENIDIARQVCNYEDDADPGAPIPRRFRNAIVAVTVLPSSLNDAIDRARRLMALEEIEREYRTGEENRLSREQIQRIKPGYVKSFRVQARRAFNQVVMAEKEPVILEEQYQVPEKQILQGAHGQSCLRKFLDAKKLIYQPGDSLDVDRFLNNILPGTTPLPENPAIFTAKAIHERFLSAPGLRLIPDAAIVRQTIIKAVGEGKLTVLDSEGTAYDAQGCVSGEEGNRKWFSTRLSTFPLEDSVHITKANSAITKEWLKEDKRKPEPGEWKTPEPIPEPIMVNNWTDALENALNRPLVELHLIANKPSDAAALLMVAQQFGAEAISLKVLSGGELKEGGEMKFAAINVKPTHPAKPLQTAQIVFNSAGEGKTYHADLTLKFGKEGRSGMQAAFQQAVDLAPEELQIKAHFEKPIETQS